MLSDMVPTGFHGAELPGCLARQVYHGYADKTQALAAMSTHENACPQCGGQMHAGRWLSQPGRRYMTMAVCPEHGAYLVRVRLVAETDGTLRANRLVYAPDSDAAKSYAAQAALPRRPHRHRCRSAAAWQES